MIQQKPIARRFGTQASLIQLLTLFIGGSSLDAGITQNACIVACLLFWTCAIILLWWHEDRISLVDLFFLRWGLLPFSLIGTPLLRPIVAEWEWWLEWWLRPVLSLGLAVLLVMPLMYLVTRIFGLNSPFDGR